MPNHVTNILRVSGDPEQVRAMFEAIKDDTVQHGAISLKRSFGYGGLGLQQPLLKAIHEWYVCLRIPFALNQLSGFFFCFLAFLFLLSLLIL